MAKRFTENAQKIILIAQEEAKRLNHDYVGTEHILLGLCAIEGTVSNKILTSLGVSFRKVRLEIEKMVGIGDTIMLLGEIPFTPRAKKVLELSVEESQQLNAQYIGTEHILLGLIREEEGMAGKILSNLGLTLPLVRDTVLNFIGDGKANDEQKTADIFHVEGGEEALYDEHHAPAETKTKQSKTPTLDEYSRDLTALAAQGQLDPVIGRDEEIERIWGIAESIDKNAAANHQALMGFENGRLMTLNIKYNSDGKKANPFAEVMSTMKTSFKLTTANHTDQQIADLMIDGCNMGIKSVSKYMNQYSDANGEIMQLANDIIVLEQNFANELRQYL